MRLKFERFLTVMTVLVLLLCTVWLAGCGTDSSTSKKSSKKSCKHEWAEATCTTPKTCTLCEETEGEALGHTGGTASCVAKAICTTCGEGYGELDADAHTGGTATCVAKAICTTCGEEYGAIDPAAHAQSLGWQKTRETHQQIYPCCNVLVGEIGEHEKENGICAVCNYNITLCGGVVQAKAGEQVQMVITLSENDSLLGLELELTYDGALTLLSVQNGSAMNGFAFNAPGDLSSGGGKFTWDALDATDVEGELLVLTFEVAADATVGNHSVLMKAKAYDGELNQRFPTVVSGTVAVTP